MHLMHPHGHRGRVSPLLGVAAFLLLTIALAGCPFTPALLVSPAAVDFGTNATRVSFTIYNEGGGTLAWSVHEVVWMGSALGWVDQDVPWLTVDPSSLVGETSTETDRVFLNADRTGLAGGTYSGAGLQIRGTGGIVTVPVSMRVSGSVGPDPDGTVVVSPTTVTLNGLSDTAEFTVENTGDALVQWYGEVAVATSDAPAGSPIQIGLSPSQGVTAAGNTTTVTVAIPDPQNFNLDVPSYRVTVRDRSTTQVLGTVDVFVDLVAPPAITLDPTTLNFGTDGYQLSFYVINTGDSNSLLDFRIFTRDDDTFTPLDINADPLLAAVFVPEGTDDVRSHPTAPELYAREVSVTISRDGIRNDLEFRELWVAGISGTTATGEPILDPDIEPQSVQIRVQAAAYVEGAINRSRPPSLMRFVFMLRDKRSVAVNAADELIRNQISFFVKEDDFPLDPDEASQFVTGPENLRSNIVILLDFTGSMYRAGVGDPLNPLQKGEAIAQMVQAAKQFVLDLPDGYRVALMVYHDRQQPSRLLHGFDTNKATLAAALDGFTLPEAEHGASELYDALQDACNVLAADDPAGTLPYDEADVRSVVFVSDGWDTSSVTELTTLIDEAKAKRVRFYPIGFTGSLASPTNDTVLTTLAQETGGHQYKAAELSDLTSLLDTETPLTFGKAQVDLASRSTVFPVRNNGDAAFVYTATKDVAWLTLAPSSASVPPLMRNDEGVVTEPGIRNMTLSVAAGLPVGTHEGHVTIASQGGSATVRVLATVGAGGGLSNLVLVPQTVDYGRLWNELAGQIVLSYTSLFQAGSHRYSIQATFPDSLGSASSAFFEEDGVFFPGDVRAGQITLSTTGISGTAAEVFVRTDYVPRNITQFRFRFIPSVPAALTPLLTPAQRTALRQSLLDQFDAGAATIAPNGLLGDWRLINEGNGVFTLVTEPDNYLSYGAFGNLMKIAFTGLGADDAFILGFRVDNALYYSPATETKPSLTKYFLYPGGLANPDEVLQVKQGTTDLAPPAASEAAFMIPVDPEAANVWDRDEDSWSDFDDADPDDDEVGDLDGDGVPDLDDPAPLDPSIP